MKLSRTFFNKVAVSILISLVIVIAASYFRNLSLDQIVASFVLFFAGILGVWTRRIAMGAFIGTLLGKPAVFFSIVNLALGVYFVWGDISPISVWTLFIIYFIIRYFAGWQTNQRAKLLGRERGAKKHFVVSIIIFVIIAIISGYFVFSYN